MPPPPQFLCASYKYKTRLLGLFFIKNHKGLFFFIKNTKD
ncbi:hypothetical protein BBAD15_m00027 (mitochondrion) [Beauveria bassiana D1-5]|uniref:Uncharacterized protein n=1 Tax=Beauveria bassiana D1-5 TaxID=1245745 RepID=A0A0A2V810_BEABA|nr:hypothetical protein BBAD15_m00027 [Beauveria bassiana D1-5]